MSEEPKCDNWRKTNIKKETANYWMWMNFFYDCTRKSNRKTEYVLEPNENGWLCRCRSDIKRIIFHFAFVRSLLLCVWAFFFSFLNSKYKDCSVVVVVFVTVIFVWLRWQTFWFNCVIFWRATDSFFSFLSLSLSDHNKSLFSW